LDRLGFDAWFCDYIMGWAKTGEPGPYFATFEGTVIPLSVGPSSDKMPIVVAVATPFSDPRELSHEFLEPCRVRPFTQLLDFDKALQRCVGFMSSLGASLGISDSVRWRRAVHRDREDHHVSCSRRDEASPCDEPRGATVMDRCVIYARVSTKEQQDEGGYSIPAQLKAILAFCASQGLTPTDGRIASYQYKRPFGVLEQDSKGAFSHTWWAILDLNQ
jgi:hypothetical protein